jgi:hypothetical protein
MFSQSANFWNCSNVTELKVSSHCCNSSLTAISEQLKGSLKCRFVVLCSCLLFIFVFFDFIWQILVVTDRPFSAVRVVAVGRAGGGVDYVHTIREPTGKTKDVCWIKWRFSATANVCLQWPAVSRKVHLQLFCTCSCLSVCLCSVTWTRSIGHDAVTVVYRINCVLLSCIAHPVTNKYGDCLRPVYTFPAVKTTNSHKSRKAARTGRWT